ncbi:MAG: hypothetical protein ACOYLQ_20495 [Hyphomicrobiaceae bacterium]
MSDVQDWRTPIDIKPIPTLAEAREHVLRRNNKRRPKWRFRLASDVAVELQADVTSCIVGKAIQLEGVNETHFERRPRGESYLLAQIRIEIGDVWRLRCTTWRVTRGRQDEVPGFLARLAALMDGGVFDQLSVGMMLSPRCLHCGRGLSDAASMARLIGPECAGTSQLDPLHTLDVSGDGVGVTVGRQMVATMRKPAADRPGDRADAGTTATGA